MRMDEIITQSDTFIGEVHQSFSVLSCRTDQSFIISIYRETRPHKACHRRDSCLTRSIERVIVTLHTGHWTCCQRLPRFSLSSFFSCLISLSRLQQSMWERGGVKKKSSFFRSEKLKKKRKSWDCQRSLPLWLSHAATFRLDKQPRLFLLPECVDMIYLSFGDMANKILISSFSFFLSHTHTHTQRERHILSLLYVQAIREIKEFRDGLRRFKSLFSHFRSGCEMAAQKRTNKNPILF